MQSQQPADRGPKLAVSDHQIQEVAALFQLERETVSWKGLLEFVRESQSLFIPDCFREALVRTILFVAGDHANIVAFWRDELKLENPSQEDLFRSSRVHSAMLSAEEALRSLPDAAITVGSIRTNLDLSVSVLASQPHTELDTIHHLGDYPVVGARMLLLRTYRHFCDEGERQEG